MLAEYIGFSKSGMGKAAGALVLVGGLGLLGLYLPICIERGNDFLAFRHVGELALEGRNIYSPTAEGIFVFYMPHFALLMEPFALLPAQVSAALWFMLKLAALGWLAREAYRAMPEGASPGARRLAVAMPLLLLAPTLNNDFRLGQVNVFVHFFVAYSLVHCQRGNRWRAAISFAVACTKATPLLLLLYFLLKRQWALLARIGVVFAALFVALWARFGSGAMNLAVEWLAVSKRMKLGIGEVADVQNQSLSGVLARLFSSQSGRTASGRLLFEGSELAVYFEPAVLVLSALLVAATSLLILKHSAGRGVDALEVSAFLLLMLVVSPDTRLFHLVHLLLPAWVFSRLALEGRVSAAQARAGALALAAVAWIPGRELLGAEGLELVRRSSLQGLALLAGLSGYLLLTKAVLQGAPQVEETAARQPVPGQS